MNDIRPLLDDHLPKGPDESFIELQFAADREWNRDNRSLRSKCIRSAGLNLRNIQPELAKLRRELPVI